MVIGAQPPVVAKKKPAAGKPKKERDPYAVELGQRIDVALREAGFKDRKAMYDASDLTDYNQLSKWCNGRALPGVRPLAEIARTCRVPLDWLVSGTESASVVYEQWIKTRGRDVDEAARRYLRRLPVAGYVVDLAFYDLALQAYRLGLKPEAAARAAHVSRVTDDRIGRGN